MQGSTIQLSGPELAIKQETVIVWTCLEKSRSITSPGCCPPRTLRGEELHPLPSPQDQILTAVMRFRQRG